ncbi:pyridoxamine 5'-phosphate oxidase family protein [Geodermatophilus sp. SYSU D01180]
MNDVQATRTALTDEECLRLLGSTSRGHLGFSRDALPAISPVRFALDGDRVVIAARHDSDHLPPSRGAVVVLGVDDQDDWAVTVVGPARAVTDPRAVVGLDALAWPAPPSRGDGHCYVVLQVGVLHGWRVAVRDSSSRRSA